MVRITRAAPDDRLDVRRVLDAAMLQVRDDLGERIDAGDVLVASDAGSDSTSVVGALVLVPRGDAQGDADDGASADAAGGAHIDAVAVRRARRGRGVGSALVRAAAERRSVLTAAFDPGVRPFYESLGFEIAPAAGDGDRLRGRYDATEE